MTNVLYINRPCHDTDIEIHTNMKELIKQIEMYYEPFIAKAQTNKSAIIKVIKNDSGIWIDMNNKRTQVRNPLQTIINFIYENTEINRSFFAIHAAAVEYNGEAFLLVGPTSSGKTTLTTYLIQQDFGYITDDCSIIDRETKEVIPFPCNIHLRSGGITALYNNNININTHFFNHIIAERYIYKPGNVVNCNVPLGKIFLIERTENTNAVEKLNCGEKIKLLLENSIQRVKISENYLKFLTQLSQYFCKKISYTEMKFVNQVIRRMDFDN